MSFDSTGLSTSGWEQVSTIDSLLVVSRISSSSKWILMTSWYAYVLSLKEHCFWAISITFIKSLQWTLDNVTLHKSRFKLVNGFSSNEIPHNTRSKYEGTFQLHIWRDVFKKTTCLVTRFKKSLLFQVYISKNLIGSEVRLIIDRTI